MTNPDDSAPRARKVGILGGTFDPVHLGHLALAEFVRKRLALDEFLFIPAPRPPHKSGLVVAAFPDRCRMLEMALAGHPGFALSRLEEARGGPSFSVDTLEDLHRLSGDLVRLFFLIGLDAFLDLPTWKSYRRLGELADLVVINRPDYPLDKVWEVVDKLGPYHYEPDGSSWLRSESGKRIHLLEMPPNEISSTRVREIAAAGGSLSSLVHPDVARYITDHRLYRRSD